MYTRTPRRVLLVEDEPLVSMKEQEILEEYGFSCSRVFSGEDAVDLALQQSNLDVVLMDLELRGGMDGAEAARRILERRELPILFLTGHDEPGYVERVRDIAHYGYLLKTAGEAVLIESLEATIRLFEKQKRLEHENRMRKRAEAELEATWQQVPSLVVLVDSDRRIRKANRSAAELAGAPEEHLIARRPGEAFGCARCLDDPQHCGTGPACRRCRLRRAVEATFHRRKGFKHVEAELEIGHGPKKERRAFILATSFLEVEDGCYVLLSAEDVTRLKRSEERLKAEIEERQHLLAEFNHRVKNHFAIVSSLIRLKDGELGDRADLSGLHSQIQTFERIHRKLQETGPTTSIPFRRYITDLLYDLFSFREGAPPHIEVSVPDLEIPVRTASTLGLIVVELATNAAKHGFDSEETPHFSIALGHDADSGYYDLTVSNTGRPFPADVDIENPASLGLRLLSASVKRRGGTIELEREPYPTFTIRVPVDS